METPTNHPTADIAPEVAQSISTGDDVLMDNSDEYMEMTADELAEFEARLIAEEAEATLGTEQDGPEQPPVPSNADIPAPPAATCGAKCWHLCSRSDLRH